MSTVVGGEGGPANLPTPDGSTPLQVDRVLTVPNAISALRLACIPLFCWLLFAQQDRQAAAWLLAVLGSTDWVDGFVARRFGQVSELGKVLDPTVDRLVFIVCGGALIIDGAIPLGFAGAVVVREVLVGGTLVALTLFGMDRFDVSWWGKTGTFLLMVAFPLFCMGASDAGWADTAQLLGWVAGVPGLSTMRLRGGV